MKKTKCFAVLLAVMLSFVGCTTEESSSEAGKGKLEVSRAESTAKTAAWIYPCAASKAR